MDGMVIKVGQRNLRDADVGDRRVPAAARAPTFSNLLGTRGMLQLRGESGAARPSRRSAGRQLGRRAMSARASSSSPTRAMASRFGLVVDELCGHQQVVIKSIEESYGSVPGIAAATILGNGRVAFILDVEKLSELAAISSPQVGAVVHESCRVCAKSHELTNEYTARPRTTVRGRRSGVTRMPNAVALKVLVVDDQNSVRQMTRMTLGSRSASAISTKRRMASRRWRRPRCSRST